MALSLFNFVGKTGQMSNRLIAGICRFGKHVSGVWAFIKISNKALCKKKILSLYFKKVIQNTR